MFEQYKKGKDFKFLKKAFTLLLPYWILCDLWYPFFTNRSWSGELVFEIILGDAFLPFSWYVKTQLVCYFLWFLAPHLIRYQKRPYFLVFVFLGLLIYAHYRRLAGITTTTYITVFAFWGGLLYSYWLPKWSGILAKHYCAIQISLVVICIWFSHFMRNDSLSSIVRINIFATLFAILVVQFLMLHDQWGRIPRFVGNISYELYLVQGLPLCFFSKQSFAAKTYMAVGSPLWVLLLTICFSLLMAIILYNVDRKIKKWTLPFIECIIYRASLCEADARPQFHGFFKTIDQNSGDSMEEDVKVIDLLELSKAVWKIKYFIVGCAIVGGALGYGYAYKTVTPLYQTSIDVQLPLYADTNTIGTSLQVARGPKLIQSVNDRLGIDGGIQVLANRPGNTTLLHVTFRGTNPQLIKKYSDTYQGALLDTLNTFINEKTIIDMQKANLQTPNPLSREELLARISLSRAQIVKEGAIPTARVDEGYTKKTVYGIILGLAISIGYGVLRYLKALFLPK